MIRRTHAPARRLVVSIEGTDREALRILLNARGELTTVTAAQTNRLRALLLGSDRQLARGRLTDATLAALARRRPPHDAARPTTPIASTACDTPRSVASLSLCAMVPAR